MECETSKEAWDSLRDLFASENLSLESQLLGDFHSLNLSDCGDMEDYLYKVHALSDQLAAVGSPISNGLVISKIFGGLPKEYQNLLPIGITPD